MNGLICLNYSHNILVFDKCYLNIKRDKILDFFSSTFTSFIKLLFVIPLCKICMLLIEIYITRIKFLFL